MQNPTTWCLVCDASRAHLFRRGLPKGPFEPLSSFDHPPGRAKIVDLVSDANGRKPVGGSHGDGAGSRPGGFHGRPGAAPETDPKEVEALRFAQDLAGVLAKGLDDRAYEALMLVAPPHFLGVIKAALDGQVAKRLQATLDKDFAEMDPREIARRLRLWRAA